MKENKKYLIFIPLIVIPLILLNGCECKENITTTTEKTTTTSLITTTTETVITESTTTTLINVENPPGWHEEWPNFNEGMIVNVKHFGATGDGVTDDTPAIQNAIDFAAGEKTLDEVASESMNESWRLYYTFWTDIKKYRDTGVWNPTYDYYELGMLEE